MRVPSKWQNHRVLQYTRLLFLPSGGDVQRVYGVAAQSIAVNNGRKSVSSVDDTIGVHSLLSVCGLSVGVVVGELLQQNIHVFIFCEGEK